MQDIIIIKIDENLLNGEVLRFAHYIPSLDIKWYFLSENPMTRNIDDFIKISAEEFIKKFPEAKELLVLDPKDKRLSFQKGLHSNKWYDFI